MGSVFSIDDMPWADLKGLPGARGFEFKALTTDAYTRSYSCELVRLGLKTTPCHTSSRGATCFTS